MFAFKIFHIQENVRLKLTGLRGKQIWNKPLENYNPVTRALTKRLIGTWEGRSINLAGGCHKHIKTHQNKARRYSTNKSGTWPRGAVLWGATISRAPHKIGKSLERKFQVQALIFYYSPIRATSVSAGSSVAKLRAISSPLEIVTPSSQPYYWFPLPRKTSHMQQCNFCVQLVKFSNF